MQLTKEIDIFTSILDIQRSYGQKQVLITNNKGLPQLGGTWKFNIASKLKSK